MSAYDEKSFAALKPQPASPIAATSSTRAGGGTLQDHRRALLADHRRRRVGVAADQRRHDRGVNDAQAFEAADAQLRIDDGEIVTPHLAGADRVIDRLGVAPHPVAD